MHGGGVCAQSNSRPYLSSGLNGKLWFPPQGAAGVARPFGTCRTSENCLRMPLAASVRSKDITSGVTTRINSKQSLFRILGDFHA